MVRKNPVIKKLEEELEGIRRDLRYEKEARIKAEGKVEVYKEKEEKERQEFRHQEHEMQSQVEWLRFLVENMTIPSEKLELLIKRREQDLAMRRY